MKSTVGVIIARIQAPDLTEAHMELISRILGAHKKVLLLLGTPPVKNRDAKNPLSYQMRQEMVTRYFPSVTVAPIADHPSDKEWTRAVDKIIKDLFPTESVVLYGGRDSFIPHYTGAFRTVALEPLPGLSGTEARNLAGEIVINSSDFRAGVVYSTQNKFPTSYQIVDIALVKQYNYNAEPLPAPLLALGKKDIYGNYYAFPGGFVDPEDASLEHAAARELREETGYQNLPVEEFKYIGSVRIDDWRYRDCEDKILSAMFFVGAEHGWGGLNPNDDLESVEWVEINKELRGKVQDAHKPVLDALYKYMGVEF
jgi:bifunctional NMN adenylyltransferase/nudix hydrolase